MTPAILIVEDEALIGLDLEDALRGAGYQTIGPARTIGEANALLASHVCDAALIDIVLSDGTSVPIADMLRARRIPFAFVSGSQADILPSHLSNEIFLTKPSHPSTVIEAVRGLLRKRPAETPPNAS